MQIGENREKTGIFPICRCIMQIGKTKMIDLNREFVLMGCLRTQGQGGLFQNAHIGKLVLISPTAPFGIPHIRAFPPGGHTQMQRAECVDPAGIQRHLQQVLSLRNLRHRQRIRRQYDLTCLPAIQSDGNEGAVIIVGGDLQISRPAEEGNPVCDLRPVEGHSLASDGAKADPYRRFRDGGQRTHRPNAESADQDVVLDADSGADGRPEDQLVHTLFHGRQVSAGTTGSDSESARQWFPADLPAPFR